MAKFHQRMKLCERMLSRFSYVRLFAILWTVAHQVPLSMGFSRQECWSGLPFPTPGIFPNPGIEPESLASLALQADPLPLSHQRSPCFLELRTKVRSGTGSGAWAESRLASTSW